MNAATKTFTQPSAREERISEIRNKLMIDLSPISYLRPDNQSEPRNEPEMYEC